MARAQQAAVSLGSSRDTQHAAVAHPRWRESHSELALVVRRATNLPPTDRAPGMTHFRLGAYDASNTAESIYLALRDEVATPALRRFARADSGAPAGRKSGAHASRSSARTHTMAGEPPLFDDLRSHLRVEAHVLAQRGLDVAKVRRRLDALFRHEHPSLSWRSLRIGLARDALPFAFGATLLSSFADLVDPRRTQSLMWPPVEALGVVMVNLIGMARFNAAHPALRSRLTHVTPSQALEALQTMLRNPVRDVAGHIVGFVFCYGVLRNLARLAVELGISAAAPGIMSHRFANTIHSCLEILLAPIPGALLLPIVDRIAISPENARLELLLQDRFADLICEFSDDVPASADAPFWPAFWAELTGSLRTGAPKAIWLTLTLGFYFLSTFHAQAGAPDDDEAAFDAALALDGNSSTTLPPVDEHSDGVDWHTQMVLSVLYSLIATAISLQGIATRHDALCTAYTRRRGRPKVSTITVTSQGDSGRSSVGSHSDASPSPASPHDDAFGGMGGRHTDPGDTSGDESVFLPMDDAHNGWPPDTLETASTVAKRDKAATPITAGTTRVARAPVAARTAKTPHTPHTRKQGTSVAPSGVARHTAPPNAEDDDDDEDRHTAL
ncbi:hypothetical protein [Pandoraea sp. NPDC087047]|uniref:hypothetical protein n=1 Tax=Pandoraea sp. NPDC087047 TaxID=3364390 RepID=UPI0037F5C813